MPKPDTLDRRLLATIANLHNRLVEKGLGDRDILQKVQEASHKALVRLGHDPKKDKSLDKRAKQLATKAIQHAQGAAPKSAQEMPQPPVGTDLRQLTIRTEAGDYAVSFLPDAGIADTPSNKGSWKKFLELLAPKTRVSTDPDSGAVGVPYRNGHWLTSLTLGDDVKVLGVHQALTHIDGSVQARGALKVDKGFTQTLRVEADLCLNHGILRQGAPDITFGGRLVLLGLRSPLDAVFTPMDLQNWGLKHGQGVTISSDHFKYSVPQGDQVRAMLEGENVYTDYHWRGSRWEAVKRKRISPERFETLHARLTRLCIELGLGAESIAKSVSRTPENLDRIALYLDMILSLHDKVEPEEAEAAENVLAALDELRTLFTAPMVDEKALDKAQANLSDKDRDILLPLLDRPRAKGREKDLRDDLTWINRLEDEDVDQELLLGDGAQALGALLEALESDTMQSQVAELLTPLKSAYMQLLAVIRAPGLPSVSQLLRTPAPALAVLKQTAGPFGDKADFRTLADEIGRLQRATATTLVRSLAGTPMRSPDETTLKDRALLQTLADLKPSTFADLDLGAPDLLRIVLARMNSSMARRMTTGLKDSKVDDALARAMAADTADIAPQRILGLMRRWLRAHLDTLRQVNSLGTIDYAKGREEARRDKQLAMTDLPAHITKELTARLVRLCLTTGLGRDFIQETALALEDNLFRLRLYLDIALGKAPGAPTPLLKAGDKMLVKSTADTLAKLTQGLQASDEAQTTAALKRLSNDELKRLGTVLDKPRNRVDLRPLDEDRQWLEKLLDASPSLEEIFGGPGRFLLFVNTCFTSQEAKTAIAKYIKPIFFALAQMGKDASGVTTNHMLQRAGHPADVLDRAVLKKHPDAARDLAKILADINERSVEETLTELQRACSAPGDEKLKSDLDLLSRLAKLPGSPLDAARLIASRSALLVEQGLQSHIGNEVHQRQKRGEYEDRTTRSIVTSILEDLQRELVVYRAYNRLTTVPR